MTGSPIFQTTSQALHFSFLMEALEASSESIMAKVLRAHLMKMGLWVTEPSTVNFEGLNALEIRGQCAMVRNIVRDYLPGPESWQVISKYSLTRTYPKPDGDVGFYFTDDRATAIKKLARWLEPDLKIHIGSILLLVTRQVCEVSTQKPTLAEIAKLHDISEMTASRYAKKIAVRLSELEALAIDRLEPIFERDGLILTHYA